MRLLNQLLYKRRRYFGDDFDWDHYTADSYQRRLEGDVDSHYRMTPDQGSLSIDAETGHVKSSGVPLHPNHCAILEAIAQLKPESVHEVGCGGGIHLANVVELFPDVTVTGGDRGATQLELALSRNPELTGKVGHQDITMPFSDAWPKADLVYTHAVVMHIHTAVSHLVALANIVRQAKKYVLLVENQQCHNYVSDLERLEAGGHLPEGDWHYYLFTGSSDGKGLLLSRTLLDLPRVSSDAEMRAGDKPSQRRLKKSDEDSARGIFGFLTR